MFAHSSPRANGAHPRTSHSTDGSGSNYCSLSRQFWHHLSSGRLPLFLVIVVILLFIAWHTETEPERLQEEITRIKMEEESQSVQQEAAEQQHLVMGEGASPRSRLPVKSSYRCLLIGDSLTAGYYWKDGVRQYHPYLLTLRRLLAERHPHLNIDFVLDATPGECVISKCVNQSLVARAKHHVKILPGDTPEQKRHKYVDLAIILGGTNDIFHDFDADDIFNGLREMHQLIWNQSPPPLPDAPSSHHLSTPPSAPKTLALTVPQFGMSDAWRPSRRPSKLPELVAARARGTINRQLSALCREHSEQCVLVNLDRWFPRWTLTERERQRKWTEDVHPTPDGYDEIGLVVYQHIKRILPLS